MHTANITKRINTLIYIILTNSWDAPTPCWGVQFRPYLTEWFAQCQQLQPNYFLPFPALPSAYFRNRPLTQHWTNTTMHKFELSGVDVHACNIYEPSGTTWSWKWRQKVKWTLEQVTKSIRTKCSAKQLGEMFRDHKQPSTMMIKSKKKKNLPWFIKHMVLWSVALIFVIQAKAHERQNQF